MSFSFDKETLKELGFEKRKRRSMSNKERLSIAEKTNFRCGYCGCPLPDRFHIDHMEFFARTGNEDEFNLMAACPSCNNYKGVYCLEQFRRELAENVNRARKYSVNFRMAERFGLIQEVDRDIVFYFERLRMEQPF